MGNDSPDSVALQLEIERLREEVALLRTAPHSQTEPCDDQEALSEATERRRPVERFQQLADEQRTILDTVTIGVCHLKERRLQWANPAFLAMFGYQLEEVQGSDTMQFYRSRDDYERVGREGYAQLAEGKNYTTEVRLQRRNGSPFWCILSGQAIDPRDVDGGAIWALQDITERRSVEEELRRSEARLDVAQVQAEIGSWDLDPVTQTGYWSNEMFRLLAFDPAQGVPPLPAFLEVIHPEDRSRLLEALERASASQEAIAIHVRSDPARAPMRHLISNIQAARDPSGRLRHLFGTLQDVTARVQAEAAAHEGQERLALALRGADLGSWDWDITTDTVRFDERWTEMLGYGLHEIDPHLRSWERLVHPDDMHDVRAVLDAHLAGQTAAYEVEHRLRHRSGSWVWVLSRGKVIVRDAAGKPLRAVGTHLDVTERRRKDDALRASEHKLAEVFRASPEFIIVSTKAEGRLIEVNPAFLTLFDHDRDAVIGRTAFDIGLWPTPDDRDRVVGQLDRRGHLQELETQGRKRTGEIVEVLLSMAPITIDGQECILTLGIDISKRKKAEEALRESARRFERLVQNSSDVTVIADAEGWLRSISGPAKTMLGFEPTELLGLRIFDVIHTQDAALARTVFSATTANPGIAHRVECRFRHQNGNWIPTEMVATSWLHDPLVHGVVLNIRDISERKNAETERARLQEQLQQATKMEAVGRLAGGVAHDFNNLLTVILGFADLAATNLATADPFQRYLKGITQAADSAASLTRQLLAFSRRQIVQPRVLSLNDLVENVRPMLARLIGEDVSLQAVLADDLGATRIDPGQFDQVLANLAVNARDAMPGGGRLTIETANIDLDESYCSSHADVRPGRYVMLAVSDNGQGMDETVKQRLFEPFFTTKTRGRGTGLGLAVTFGIVKQAGGTVEVYSELGRGTTFKFYLPRVTEAAEALSEPPLSADVEPGYETILLVEDEASVRELAATTLAQLGYEVLVASDGSGALALAERRELPIALLLTDVVMPGMNGKELAERLRQAHPETRVLYTSGYTEDVIVLHGVLEDHLDFIGKPFSRQALARKVRQILDAQS